MTFRSNAQWPLDVYRGPYGDGVTADPHATKEEAEAVCASLEKHGFGGMYQDYPIMTWVSEEPYH